MKKSYIAPEIKTMVVENVIMAASGENSPQLGSNAGDLSLGRSRYSSSWDDSADDDLAWE